MMCALLNCIAYLTCFNSIYIGISPKAMALML